MDAQSMLGPFEEMVLLSLWRLGEDAYGMRVRRELERRGRPGVSIGAVYAALDRLETKGYVSSSDQAGDGSRDGRARRFFVLEPAGAGALIHTAELRRQAWSGIELAELDRLAERSR